MRHSCRTCGHLQYVADSEQYWDDDQAYISVCDCEEELFNVATGFSLYGELDDPDGIRSLATAERCLACGTVASLAQWMIRTGDLTLLSDP